MGTSSVLGGLSGLGLDHLGDDDEGKKPNPTPSRNPEVPEDTIAQNLCRVGRATMNVL